MIMNQKPTNGQATVDTGDYQTLTRKMKTKMTTLKQEVDDLNQKLQHTQTRYLQLSREYELKLAALQTITEMMKGVNRSSEAD